jgi:protein arginine kinase
MGDFYQVSNQITLGRSEEELVKQVGDIVPVIIDYERQARDFLIKESHENLHDQVSRAYAILRGARTISSEETMHLLSSVRMGVNLGLIPELGIPAVNELFIHTQPAHLQKLSGAELDTTDRNIERAQYLRRHLNKDEEPGAAKN